MERGQRSGWQGVLAAIAVGQRLDESRLDPPDKGHFKPGTDDSSDQRPHNAAASSPEGALVALFSLVVAGALVAIGRRAAVRMRDDRAVRTRGDTNFFALDRPQW
jgi:hypothetical protein